MISYSEIQLSILPPYLTRSLAVHRGFLQLLPRSWVVIGVLFLNTPKLSSWHDATQTLLYPGTS